MKTRSWKRFGSCLMALAMVLSGTALPASAATPGKDGSAEMNEAYAAHESLMPIGPSFSVATLLEWTPESDPDARYSRASIPMANREGGFVVNPKANPEAKLMLCSLANSSHDTTSSQGTENFMSWSFNYWQYTNSFVYWSGSEEGLICCPTGEFTDAAHTNGVPVVATLGFPWGSGSGYAEEVDAFCQKAEDGSFPVADKLLEVMDYYGFDGYFFNQESFGCSAEIASRLDEMIRYMRAKCPDILISWYDSMLPSGGVSYQNAVNSSNQRWMERSDDGSVGINEFFMNYNWYTGQISTTVSTMNSINRSPFDAYAGLDVQQNGMNTPFRDELLVDEDGKLKLSIALYCPNSTLGNSANGAQFHEVEQDFYVNSASDPRVEVANVSSSTWLGMSRFFADKTPILSTPFVTSFNSGHGVGYYVNGELSRDNEWSYQSVQDVMPTWTWIIDSDGSKLDGGYDFTDAYNGGTSIQFYGDLDANKANDIMLYSTDVAVTDGMTLSLTAKNDDGKARLVAYYGDDSTASYEECETVAYDLTASEADTWTTTVVDISDHAGKTLYAIGLKVESDTAVSDYHINLGQLAILDQDRAALSGPTSVALDEILYHNAYDAEARIYWDAVDGAASYEIYKVNANGTSNLIMETPNTAFYLPTLVRDFDEDDVTLKVVPVNANGVRGEGTELIIDWLYSNEDSEVYEPKEFENVCLGATVTGYSGQNESEPASKAIDGTSLNGSKWCVTNAETGYMDIDIGREVTVRRWRVEHAQYGGEDVLMNTVDFALEYKNASGRWVEAKRIQNNTAAVTDVLLDEPVTAQEWRLRIYDDGTSPWGGIRIYEWQMFETAEFPQTEPVSIQFAAAENGTGANDTFTLKNVPAGQTVTVYTKSGSEYNKIGEAVAESGTVTITGLNFGTQEAGRIYYTTTATGSAESIKLSASFEAENAAKSEAAKDVTAKAYSQPGSLSSSNGGDIYISLTVNGLSEGDVVYVYENDSGEYTKASLPVAAGETSVIIRGIRVPRAGSELTLQVKRVRKLISDKYTVEIPAFPEPTAFLNLVATNAKGEKLTGVTYGVYNSNNEKVYTVTTGEPAEVVLGTYTIKCENVPAGYLINDTVVKRADNSNLVAAINSIKELDESRYQPDSWAALAQALAEAEKVAANRDATADEIEAAYTKLEAAYKALALRADMTAIDDMISKVEAMDANAHTAKSWKLVADALEAAKTVAANENATQEAVDAAARTLQAAAAALVKAGDATELNALVEETKQLDLSKYTVESADAIRQAISDAEAAIAGRASAEDLKAALDAVRNAVNTAQTKPAAPVQKPADTVKPVQKPADTVKDEHPDIAGGIANGTWGAAPTAKPNDGSAAASGSGATSAIPQTSDNFPYEVLSILACMAVGGFIVALYLKKRRGNR